MSRSSEAMLNMLGDSMKQMKSLVRMQGELTDELITQLPDDKKKEALLLMSEAKKGKLDMQKLVEFGRTMKGVQNKDFEDKMEETLDRLNKKRAQMSKEKKTKKKPVKKNPPKPKNKK